jgi:hypothetical protein
MDHASESEYEPSSGNGELRNNHDDGVIGKDTRIEEHDQQTPSTRRLKQRRQEHQGDVGHGHVHPYAIQGDAVAHIAARRGSPALEKVSVTQGYNSATVATKHQPLHRSSGAAQCHTCDRHQRSGRGFSGTSPTEQSRLQRKHRHTPNQCENNTCGWSHQPVRRRARRHRSTIARERIRQGRGVVASPSVQVSIGEQIWSTPSSEPHTPRTNARTTCVITVSRRRTATPCDTGDDGTGNRKAVRPSFHKDDLTNQCKTPSLLVPERRWRQSARRAPTPNWR